MRVARLVLCALLLAAAARAESKEEREREEKHGEARPGDDELLYAMGVLLGQRIQGYGLSAKELSRVQQGFGDAAAGRKVKLRDPGDLEEWGQRVDAMMQRRGNPRVAAEKEKGAQLAAREAREAGAERLDSGVVLRVLSAGNGAQLSPGARVQVKYEGRTADGKVFDSSQSAEVPIDQVVKCWAIAASKLRVGTKARLVCPSAVAYGDQGRPPQVAPGASVIFDLEVLGLSR